MPQDNSRFHYQSASCTGTNSSNLIAFRAISEGSRSSSGSARAQYLGRTDPAAVKGAIALLAEQASFLGAEASGVGPFGWLVSQNQISSMGLGA